MHFIILGTQCGAKIATRHVLFNVKDNFEACYFIKGETPAVFERANIDLKK